MADVNGLEKQLNDVFGKQAPKMPKGLYDFLVQYAPILTLVGAVLTAWSALVLWQLAHSADTVVKWAMISAVHTVAKRLPPAI
ncbi:hypothetical protein IPL68_04745 [Candidatus Saccharibacteria bacterium]|nr:MAG: hypothetical protein IPL68_04745 [Candidatus Saccharibacteria bacterium]